MRGSRSLAPAERSDAERSAQLVLGTAGHIDHGKTALIRALTGVDTDRLPEEKARGITIDLGFAPLDLAPGERISVVDVPGHERLVRTMVSGATGIDLVMLVVAADEGVMPQTREHVAICNLLGIERGVVALTKADLADDEVRELARDEVSELLADTSLARAPIFEVSSTTGDGVEALRSGLLALVQEAGPRTPRAGPPRLAIDRVFAMKGFGTVVTGTLVGAPFSVGEAVEIQPGEIASRIRGLQSHGVACQSVLPGERCAINLQGVEVRELSRGQVVTRKSALAPTRVVDLQVLWLPSAAEAEGGASIEFLTGTSERRAQLAPIGCSTFLPGQEHYARVHIEGDPVALLPGDRFIARGFARTEGTGGTLGGGVVLDVAPPHRRRSDPTLVRELEILTRRDPACDLRERVVRTGLAGTDEAALARETGIAGSELDRQLRRLETDGVLLRAGARYWLSVDAARRMEGRLCEALDAFHAAEPLRPGMPRGALRGQLPDNVSTEVADLALARLEAAGEVALEGELARRPAHTARLDSESEAAVKQIRDEAQASGLDPPSPREWAERLSLSPERFRDLLAYLERERVLVRAPGDLWFDREAVEGLRAGVVAHLKQHGEIDTGTYKSLTGTSRRTTVPLMELLDELHVTRRKGDVRILRNG